MTPEEFYNISGIFPHVLNRDEKIFSYYDMMYFIDCYYKRKYSLIENFHKVNNDGPKCEKCGQKYAEYSLSSNSVPFLKCKNKNCM